ncbi:MAG TPA: L,D-transpeptidase [Thermoanaerobaculia bacterium]|nr:L,D-transpeptidase [Thermoanaerobaculia bacterium]
MNRPDFSASKRFFSATFLTLILALSSGVYAAGMTDWVSTVESPSTPEFITEGLPADAPLEGTLITIDTTENVLYLFRDGELVKKDVAATGMDKVLKKGKRTWLFRTPRGIHKVLRKIVDPIWTKPDWAFIEKGQAVPPMSSPKRKEKGVLGKYALDLGDGILIHGTKELKSLGTKASHGCIRLGPEMLETIFREADVGTQVYIF